MTQDRSTARDARQWRTTGFRRWWPVLLMASFLGDGTSSVLRLTSRGPSSLPRAGDIVFVVLAALGLIASVVLVVLTQRTQVTLEAEGVAVRAGRRKFFPYQSIDKAYRDRWSSGAVTLQLRDGRKEVLPAPTAGFGPNAQLDAVVLLIQQRVASSVVPDPEAGAS
ncbi:MAG TPA: hypothetical protein VGC37_12205 [Friedmanniella sp.]